MRKGKSRKILDLIKCAYKQEKKEVVIQLPYSQRLFVLDERGLLVLSLPF